MIRLYRSNHFALTEIRATGKKNVAGVLCFEGLPSVYGSSKEITAVESGVVVRAGKNNNIHSREHRLGTVVTVTGRNGVNLTYGRLACRTVNEGDYVHAGDVIGIEGSSGAGSGDYLTLEFRRNGRRVDGCKYLGIPRKEGEFKPPLEPAAYIVCRACGISEQMRDHINILPEASELWEKLLAKLRK